jgi:hypothetical protein
MYVLCRRFHNLLIGVVGDPITMAFTLQSKVAQGAVRPSFSRRAVVSRAALELKAPPYGLDALEPHMSKQTLEFHWGEIYSAKWPFMHVSG